MNTLSTGQIAEKVVAKKLQKMGYKILAKNWKTPVCEIDIVAKKAEVVYFTEVKYRSTASQGGGWDYIGSAKLQKMEFAGRTWCQHNRYHGDWRLLAAEVSGQTGDINIVEVEK